MLAAWTAALLAARVGAETTDEWHARMGSLFEQEFEAVKDGKITYMAVAVSDPKYGDQAWWFGGYDGRAATREDHFGVGSISKSFGATVALQLAEEGVLDLEQTVGHYLGDQFPAYDNYTLKECLGMRTRIPDAFNVKDSFVKTMFEDPSARASLETIIEDALADPLLPPLGDSAAYSTTNYLTLELLVEHVTGRPMRDLVAEYALEPLGLSETSLPPRDSSGKLAEPASRPYAGPSCVEELEEVGADGVDTGWTLDEIFPALVVTSTGGGMESTIDDLLKWAKSGAGDAILSPETVAERHEFHTMGFPRKYGLGLEGFPHTRFDPRLNVPGAWYGHSGDSFGFATGAWKSDDYDASFAVVVNTCSFLMFTIRIQQLYQQDLEARLTTPAPTATTPAPAAATSPAPAGGASSAPTGGASSAAPTTPRGGSDAASSRGPTLVAALVAAAVLLLSATAVTGTTAW